MSNKETNNTGGQAIASRWSTTKSISTAITALIICVVLFAWLNSLNLRLVNSIVKASPYSYPGITYEEAFGNFYANTKWEDASTDGQQIVRFSGDCTINGKKASVTMNFWLNGNEFSLHDGTVNGSKAGVADLTTLHNKPFDDYKK